MRGEAKQNGRLLCINHMNQDDYISYQLLMRWVIRPVASIKLKRYMKRELRYACANSGYACAICFLPVKKADWSIDHIIPQQLCWELGLENLIIDPRNLRLAHKDCNNQRGSNIDDLPASVIKILEDRRTKLMESCFSEQATLK